MCPPLSLLRSLSRQQAKIDISAPKGAIFFNLLLLIQLGPNRGGRRAASRRLASCELTPDILNKILVDVKKTAAAGGNSCVFLDDVAYALKERPVERLLRELFFNARHLHCCIFLVSQTLRSIPSKVRLAASHVLAFEPANRLEANVLASEFICLDPKSAGALFVQCFNNKHDHLLIHTAERKVYSNFNQVEIPRSF